MELVCVSSFLIDDLLIDYALKFTDLIVVFSAFFSLT